jgi:hypothetical protein
LTSAIKRPQPSRVLAHSIGASSGPSQRLSWRWRWGGNGLQLGVMQVVSASRPQPSKDLSHQECSPI